MKEVDQRAILHILLLNTPLASYADIKKNHLHLSLLNAHLLTAELLQRLQMPTTDAST